MVTQPPACTALQAHQIRLHHIAVVAARFDVWSLPSAADSGTPVHEMLKKVSD